MKDKKEIIEVYHAGTDRIEFPKCKYGRKNLDFGPGFYLTDIYDQAINFARTKAADRKKSPVINKYLLNKTDILESSNYLIFDSYNDAWLDYIVACRAGKEVWKEYDYVEGGVADDRVIDTVNLFVQGFISRERALENLIYLKPNNQICLLNQELLNQHLSFKESLILPEYGIL